MLTHHETELDFNYSDIHAHQTDTRHLYFSTEVPLPLNTATFEVRLSEGIQLVSFTLTVIGFEQGQYIGKYTSSPEAELVLRFFQSIRPLV